ncbi:MAG TPA: hypothetical protein VGM78_12845, partial [Ilumatobacteraceae bacterium]
MTDVDEIGSRAGAAMREAAATLVADMAFAGTTVHPRRDRRRGWVLSLLAAAVIITVAVVAVLAAQHRTAHRLQPIAPTPAAIISEPTTTSAATSTVAPTTTPLTEPPATTAPVVQPQIEATIPVEGTHSSIVSANGLIWVGGREGPEIDAIDPATNAIVARIPWTGTWAMTVDATSATGAPTLYACSWTATAKIDTRSATITAIYPYGCQNGITVAFGGVWIEAWTKLVELGRDGSLLATMSVQRGGWGIAAGAGSIWVADGFFGPGVVTRIDPFTHQIIALIPSPVRTRNIVATDDAVWITTEADGGSTEKISLIRIDPHTNK